MIASCCHSVTFSHADDVLVVVVAALDMLKIQNARYSYSTENGFLHFHCPAMIFENIVSELLMRGVIGRGLIRWFQE